MINGSSKMVMETSLALMEHGSLPEMMKESLTMPMQMVLFSKREAAYSRQKLI
jgi:hypothetical protein